MWQRGRANNDTPNGIGFWDVIQDHNTMLLGVGIGPKRNHWAFHNQDAVPDVLIEQLLGMHPGENPCGRCNFTSFERRGPLSGNGSVQGSIAGGRSCHFHLTRSTPRMYGPLDWLLANTIN